MNPKPLLFIALSFCMSAFIPLAGAQQPSDIKFLADTLIIQADGRYEADPDLATISFDISAQDKDVKTAYAILPRPRPIDSEGARLRETRTDPGKLR